MQTVFVFLIWLFLRSDSTLLTAITRPMPVSGSKALTRSIILRLVSFGIAVRKPALPSMLFSIRAFTGHTVTQCPQDTHEDSLIGTSLSQITLGTSLVQSMLRVSLTCMSWQASTHLPQRMH